MHNYLDLYLTQRAVVWGGYQFKMNDEYILCRETSDAGISKYGFIGMYRKDNKQEYIKTFIDNENFLLKGVLGSNLFSFYHKN